MDEQVQRFFEEAIPTPALGGACMYCEEPFSWKSCEHFGTKIVKKPKPQAWKKIPNHLGEYRNQFLDTILDGYEPLEIGGERFVHISISRHMAGRDANPSKSKKMFGFYLEEMEERHIPSIPLFPIFMDLGNLESLGEHVFLFLSSLLEKLGSNNPQTNIIVAFGSSSTAAVAFQTAYFHFAKAKNPGWRFFQLIIDSERTISGESRPGYHLHPDPNMLFQHERAEFGILKKQLEETRAKLRMIHEISDLDSGIRESE
tara:strand:+ start:1611 stop:2384 length:774 start_codon:yes stop_codon:yes gene_type:complete